MPNGVVSEDYTQVCEDWITHLTHVGALHRINKLWQNVASATGVDFIIDIPAKIGLHWSATYYSKFGGLLSATYDPSVTSIGTEIPSRNMRTILPSRLKTKFYHTPTAAAGTGEAYYVGIPGGTGLAGTGTSGGNGERVELILKPGRWFVNIKPYADASDVILNAIVYEGKP